MYVISRYMQTVASKKRKRHMQVRDLKRLRGRLRERRSERQMLSGPQPPPRAARAAARERPGKSLVAASPAAAAAAPRRPLALVG